jgi:calcium-dependent protein kinase
LPYTDLKFENVMYVNEKSDQVKLIDFGLSQKFAFSQEHLHDQVGTVYTMAPELLAGDYNNKADIWSLGVMSFMLLSSSMPFFGKTRERVMHKILKGKYQFSSRRWNTISGDARKFVADCLTMNPEVRPSAEEALHLRWLSSSDTPSSDAPPELDQMDRVQACMLAFAHYSTLKKLALLVVAYKSTSDEIGFLRGMFEKYDVHEHGEISLSDFKEALSTSYDYSDFELEDMFHGIDVDGTGTIQYSEFLA